MRTAVYLAGHMRTFQSVIKSQIAELFVPNNCDLFIVTWNQIGVKRTTASGVHPPEVDDPIDPKMIEDAYAPFLKGIRIFDYARVTPSIPLHFYTGFSYMFWLIKECHALMSEYEVANQFQYDAVFRCRPDLFIQNGFHLTGPLPSDTILVPQFTDHIASDTFACGSRQAMEVYASVFFSLPEYAKRTWPQVPGSNCAGGWPEQILLTHLREHGVKLAHAPIASDVFRGGYPYLV